MLLLKLISFKKSDQIYTKTFRCHSAQILEFLVIDHRSSVKVFEDNIDLIRFFVVFWLHGVAYGILIP